ncbi:MAG: NrfD/PsrC family molybdoenzyme membrane anchor subunit [Eggerthellaceae bacterium]
MLGTLVVVYLFLGGCGAGVMCATSLWSLVFHRSMGRSLAQTRAFDCLKARCYVAGFAALCMAALCLLLDLGRPQFAFLLFTQPTTSILSFGSFVLLASLLVGGFLAAANLLYLPAVHALARKVAEAACVVLSVCLMVYTGVYVACVEAVPLWNNVAIPALFALSSASAGLSTVFIAAPFVRDWRLLERWLTALHRVHLGSSRWRR